MTGTLGWNPPFIWEPRRPSRRGRAHADARSLTRARPHPLPCEPPAGFTGLATRDYCRVQKASLCSGCDLVTCHVSSERGPGRRGGHPSAGETMARSARPVRPPAPRSFDTREIGLTCRPPRGPCKRRSAPARGQASEFPCAGRGPGRGQMIPGRSGQRGSLERRAPGVPGRARR